MVKSMPSMTPEPVYPADRIAARVGELTAEIDRDYAAGGLMLVCVLSGGLILLT